MGLVESVAQRFQGGPKKEAQVRRCRLRNIPRIGMRLPIPSEKNRKGVIPFLGHTWILWVSMFKISVLYPQWLFVVPLIGGFLIYNYHLYIADWVMICREPTNRYELGF